MPENPVSFKQTLQMRKSFIGRSCKLHFEVSPLKIVKASRQYIYDDSGQEFLDCVNNTSHVGHCHPHVVQAGQEQMSKLTSSSGFLNDQTSLYAKRLAETLPESLCVCFFLSSGSEANDLALRLASNYTKKTDVICLDSAYHGNLSNLVEIGPARHKKHDKTKTDWVHEVPTPNTYRGKYGLDCSNPGRLYADEVYKIITKRLQEGREIGAFIAEPVITAGGVIVPPAEFFTYVYRFVRDCGGVCISDEVQSGFGRCGDYFWGFQMHNVVPDIVTVGKPMGNGYPLAAVVTTKEIADSLGEFATTFGGNPVACAIGLAVLDVIKNEKLMCSAKSVGKCLKDAFKSIQHKHPMLGDVRGVGMLVGLELVMDKESRKPAKETAEILAYKLKEKKIVIGIEGKEKNVLIMLPPLCFTTDNARFVVQTFSELLAGIENNAARVGLTNREVITDNQALGVPLHVLTEQPKISVHNDSDDEEEDDDDDDPISKRAKYEGVD